MRELFLLIEKIAEDDQSTVLVLGESGTGKEMVAKAIHKHSQRHKGNFVPVNCAAIPDDLLESELFGHIKGAFTGANTSKTGRIEYADGGTLFLDEIGDMKPILQAKLLRVLQEREFEPVGGLKPISVDVRVIAATHCDLEEMVNRGEFREDLYYRLSVIPFTIPPLRERREDINLLINHFISVFGQSGNKTLLGFDRESLTTLTAFPWPGNVRELENLVQHMTILHNGKTITIQNLPEKYRNTATKNHSGHQPMKDLEHEPVQLHLFTMPTPPAENTWPHDDIKFNDMVNDFETKLIIHALKITEGNKKEAARILNLKRTTLLEKIKKKRIQDTWKIS